MTNAAPRRASRPLTPRPRRPSRAATPRTEPQRPRPRRRADRARRRRRSRLFSLSSSRKKRRRRDGRTRRSRSRRRRSRARPRPRLRAPAVTHRSRRPRASLTESLTVRESFGASDVRSEGSALLRPALVKASPRRHPPSRGRGGSAATRFSPSRTPRLAPRVHARRAPVRDVVARAEHVPRVAVQRAVRLGVAQQRQHGAAHGVQGPRRRPRVLQDVQADLARLPVHVRVKIFVSNAARGGASGYDSGSEKRTTNVPVSNGVSSGPSASRSIVKDSRRPGRWRMVASASRAASLISFSRRERLDMAPRARPPVAGTRVT